MNKNDSELISKNRAMSVAFRESILEASEEELRQALRAEGRDLDEEAARAQEVIERAFLQAGVSLPSPVKEGPEHYSELLSLLRRKKKLTEEELALQAGVPLEDIQRDGSDPALVPSLRTLARLEDFFGLRERTLSVLVGAVRVQKDTAHFHEGVEQFEWAAFSRGMGKLSGEEKRRLAQIIRFLGDYTE